MFPALDNKPEQLGGLKRQGKRLQSEPRGQKQPGNDSQAGSSSASSLKAWLLHSAQRQAARRGEDQGKAAAASLPGWRSTRVPQAPGTSSPK